MFLPVYVPVNLYVLKVFLLLKNDQVILKCHHIWLCTSTLNIFVKLSSWDAAAGFQTAILQQRPQAAGQQGARQTETLSGVVVTFL